MLLVIDFIFCTKSFKKHSEIKKEAIFCFNLSL